MCKYLSHMNQLVVTVTSSRLKHTAIYVLHIKWMLPWKYSKVSFSSIKALGYSPWTAPTTRLNKSANQNYSNTTKACYGRTSKREGQAYLTRDPKSLWEIEALHIIVARVYSHYWRFLLFPPTTRASTPLLLQVEWLWSEVLSNRDKKISRLYAITALEFVFFSRNGLIYLFCYLT